MKRVGFESILRISCCGGINSNFRGQQVRREKGVHGDTSTRTSLVHAGSSILLTSPLEWSVPCIFLTNMKTIVIRSMIKPLTPGGFDVTILLIFSAAL